MIGEFNVTKARKLLRLLNGESIPFSSFVCEVSLRLETEGFLAVVSHGRNRTFRMLDPEGCRIYMAQHYTSGMSLEDWIEIKTREKEVARSEQGTLLAFSGTRYLHIHARLRILSYSRGCSGGRHGERREFPVYPCPEVFI